MQLYLSTAKDCCVPPGLSHTDPVAQPASASAVPITKPNAFMVPPPFNSELCGIGEQGVLRPPSVNFLPRPLCARLPSVGYYVQHMNRNPKNADDGAAGDKNGDRVAGVKSPATPKVGVKSWN